MREQDKTQESFFYTDKEMIDEMTNLMLKGKPASMIRLNPKCQPDIKQKLEELEQLSLPKGGR
jgi:hypothetical protein